MENICIKTYELDEFLPIHIIKSKQLFVHQGSSSPSLFENSLDLFTDDCYSEDYFPESNLPPEYYEGAVKEVSVNKFERNPKAREKCIELNGTTCFVCDFDFEATYGNIGKSYIHVHHLVPLSEIGETYKVDCKKDLIPICPNCHAMLHREVDGKTYSWEELRRMLNKSCRRN